MKTICSWQLNAKRPRRKNLEELIQLAAEEAGVGDCPAVSVVFLSAEQMAEANMEMLGHEGATDVISFDLRDPELPEEEDAPGIELYICPEVAEKEARKRTLPYSREVTLYIVPVSLPFAFSVLPQDRDHLLPPCGENRVQYIT